MTWQQALELIVKIIGWGGSISVVVFGGVAIVRALQCLLRHDITGIYYKHADEQSPTLREYERKNLDDLYDGYHAIHGNHFVDDIYKEMREWKVVT